MPNLQLFAVISVVTAFVIVDLRSDPSGHDEVPTLVRCLSVVAYYSLSFALSAAVCYGIYLVTPEPPAPPSSLISGIWDVVSGQLYRDIREALERELTYYALFALFSTIAFCSSLFTLRYVKTAKRLLILSSPGVCLSVYFVVETITDATHG